MTTHRTSSTCSTEPQNTNRCIRPFLPICCSILLIWFVSFSLLFFFWQYRRIFQRPELRSRCVDMEERVLHVWVSVDTHQYISCPQTSHFLTCVVLYHHRREKTDSDIQHIVTTDHRAPYLLSSNFWSIQTYPSFIRRGRLTLNVARQYICNYFLPTQYISLPKYILHILSS